MTLQTAQKNPDNYNHNLNTLANLKINDKVEAKNGRLVLLPRSDMLSKQRDSSSFHIASLFSSNTPQRDIHELVNQTCQQLFAETLRKHKGPLSSTSQPLKATREIAKKVVAAIDLLGKHILPGQLKEDLLELADSPETLEARLALRAGLQPYVLNKTMSGTYIMQNRFQEPWGIFKPGVQEVGASKNPDWETWLTLRAEEWGIESGTGYLRECIAYRLDKGFANVPLTAITHFAHANLDTSFIRIGVPDLVGSFQLFKHDCIALGHALGSYEVVEGAPPKHKATLWQKVATIAWRCIFKLGFPHVPVDQIHRMGILDIRLLNCDRHRGNCLIDKNSNLYPIDHGLILPGNANCLRFDWKDLIQAHIPFSNKELKYIANIDSEQDAEIIMACGIKSSESIERMKLSTKLLKACALKGMTLHEIADLMLGDSQSAAKKPQDRTSHFEKVICHRVFNLKERAEDVIKSEIEAYLKPPIAARPADVKAPAAQ